MRRGAAVALLLAATAAGCGFGKPRPIPSTPGTTQEGIASWYGPGFHGRRTANGEIYDQYGLTAAHQTLPHGTRVRVTNLANERSVLVRINDRGPFVDGRIIDLSYTAAREIHMIGPGIVPVRIEVVDPTWQEPVLVAAPPPPNPPPVAAAPPPSPAVVNAVPPPPVRVVAPPPAVRAATQAVAVDAPAPAVAVAPVPAAAAYAVQVGAFSDYARARRTQRSLASQGARPRLALVEEGGLRYYRLRLGPFAEQQEALRAVERVNALGYRALIVAERPIWQ